MNYYITIVDRKAADKELILHFSEKDSVRLAYAGSDSKSDNFIIGSRLDFSLLVDDCDEGKYDIYFTNEENRFKVDLFLKKEGDDDILVFSGFLLPETYDEPYHDETFFVHFSATDGLGLLKGKYLSDEFYNDEKRVFDFISETISLTNVDLDIFFSPAIINPNRLWREMYLNGNFFEDDDAYKILNDILFSMRCQLYQSMGQWKIEGVNKRQLLKSYFELIGVGVVGVSVYKNTKNLKWISDPKISLVPSVRSVSANHPIKSLTLPTGIVNPSEEDFFVNEHSNIQKYLTSDWQYTSNYYPVFYTGKSNLWVKNDGDASRTALFALRNRELVEEGETYRFRLGVKAHLKSGVNITDDFLRGITNSFKYIVTVNDVEIISNEDRMPQDDVSLVFEDDLKASVDYTFNVPVTGFINIKIINPHMIIEPSPWIGETFNEAVEGFWFEELSLELVSKEDKEDESTQIVDDESTIEREFTIPISEDLSNRTPNFQLEKRVQDLPNTVGTKFFEIFRKFESDGVTYYSVSPEAATAADIFIDDVFIYRPLSGGAVPITDIEVIYNFKGGDIFVIADYGNTVTPDPEILLRVDFRKRDNLFWSNLNEWREWSDAIYPIKKDGFLDAVVDVESSLFEAPIMQIEGECLNPIKFDDIVVFPWQGGIRYFQVNNCEWNITRGISNVLLQEVKYKGHSVIELPPFVFAGDDIIIDGNTSSATPVDANSYSPQGTIEAYEWEEVTSFGATIVNDDQLIPTFENLSFGNKYVFRLTVIDNFGNIDSDEVAVDWIYKGELKLELEHEYYNPPGINNPASFYRRWKVSTDWINYPPEDYMYNLNYKASLFYDAFDKVTASITIEKDGVIITSHLIDRELWMPGQGITRSRRFFDGVLSLFRGDEFTLILNIEWQYSTMPPPYSEIQSKITFESIDKGIGEIQINNVPLSLENFFGYGVAR